MHLTKQTRRTILIGVVLSAVTLAVYWPVTGDDFINCDDPFYVTINAHVLGGLSWANVGWAFSTVFYDYYHPLSWLSHMVDVELFGLKPGWHHLTSLLFHIVNTLLLFQVLRRMTGAVWRSACVAALFALHPLHVESVAWVTERKDVLSGFFFLLTLWAYARYAEVQSPKSKVQSRETEVQSPMSNVQGRETEVQSPMSNVQSPGTGHAPRFTFHVSRFYVLSLLFFALGLMSKPMLVTLPFVLLLLDYWPLRRFQLPRLWTLDFRLWTSSPDASPTPLLRLVVEKLPFLAFSVAISVVTFEAQNNVGSVSSLGSLPLTQRVGTALMGYAGYLRHAFWPAGLAIFYPMPSQWPLEAVAAAGAVVLGITAWVMWCAQPSPPPGARPSPGAAGPEPAGAPAGGETSLPADVAAPGEGRAPGAAAMRRARPYLAVGWFWFLGMLVPVIGLVQSGAQQMADRYTYLPLIGVFIMLVWGVSEAFEEWEIRRPKPEGRKQAEGSGLLSAAAPQAGASFGFRPSGFGLPQLAAAGLAGLVLLACAAVTSRQVGWWRDNQRLFQHALDVTQGNYMAHNNLAGDYLVRGEWDGAIEHYQTSLAMQPLQTHQLEIHIALAKALSKRGRYAEAAGQFAEVLQAQPDNVGALVQLGIARARQGMGPEAERAFAEALRLDPNNASAHDSFGNVLAQEGRHEEAVRQFEEALRAQPDNTGTLNNLAISCKKLGRVSEAIGHYREAIRLQPDSVEALNNLAWMLAAYPDAQFRNGAEAVQLATRACELTKYQNPVTLTTLAAAYAETGQFQTAISFAEQAQELAKGSQGALAGRLSAMIEAFRAGRSYHAD